jgi:uncharacterized alkaline shock family protein YloU
MSNTVGGTLSVSDNVIADLAGYAAMECYGVVGMAAPSIKDGIAKLLPANRLRRGILVNHGEDGVKVSLYIIIEDGMNIATISQNLVDRVRFALETEAGVPVESIDIHVQDILVRK